MLVSESTYIFTNYFTLHIWTLDISLLYNQNDKHYEGMLKKNNKKQQQQQKTVHISHSRLPCLLKLQNKNPINLILSIHTVSLVKLPLLPNRKVKQYSQLIEAGFS